MYEAFQAYRGNIVMFTTGLAVFCAALVIAWPYLSPDALGARKRRFVDAAQGGRPSDVGRPDRETEALASRQ